MFLRRLVGLPLVPSVIRDVIRNLDINEVVGKSLKFIFIVRLVRVGFARNIWPEEVNRIADTPVFGTGVVVRMLAMSLGLPTRWASDGLRSAPFATGWDLLNTCRRSG